MVTRVQRLALIVALGSFGGCEIDASVGVDQVASAGGGAGELPSEGSGSTGAQRGDSDPGAGGGEGGGSDGQPGGSSGEVVDTGGEPDDGTDELPLCQVHDGDTACAACRKSDCCDRIVNCHDAPGCWCFWTCVAEMDLTVDACTADCAFDGNQFSQMVECQQEFCLPQCGTSMPTDHPPDSMMPGQTLPD
ncbi:MAG: hypothetical protein AAF721_40995 [Myxococcota bacterium]